MSVHNLAPTATLEVPATSSAGLELVLSVGSTSDASVADRLAGFVYAFDCGDGVGYGAFIGDASSSCDTSATGIRTVRAKISDKDSGIAEYSATVHVIVTFDSLCELTRQYVSKAGLENSLCVKLAAAEASYGAGRSTAKAGQLAAYRNQVAAHSGRALTRQQATLLATLSTEL